jgi:hypothetical protein
MLDKKLYEYAVIRYVPKVEREEFINIGVILFSKQAKFLSVLFVGEHHRLCTFHPDCDTEQLRSYMQSFQWICEGNPKGGIMAKEDQPARFRWLSAARSTIFQVSKIHPGYGEDMQKELERLFDEYVL